MLRIGALFLGAGDLHTCTAGVLDSTAGDLIITAAHCVAEGMDTTFVAGFKDTADPAYDLEGRRDLPRPAMGEEPGSAGGLRDPARGARRRRVGRGGRGWRTHSGFRAESRARSCPSPATGLASEAVRSAARGRPESAPGGFPSLPCAGLVDGTSGAPWTVGPTITGLVGGLDGGGCDENISYSPPFDDAVVALLTRAEAGGPADPAPTTFDDDC